MRSVMWPVPTLNTCGSLCLPMSFAMELWILSLCCRQLSTAGQATGHKQHGEDLWRQDYSTPLFVNIHPAITSYASSKFISERHTDNLAYSRALHSTSFRWLIDSAGLQCKCLGSIVIWELLRISVEEHRSYPRITVAESATQWQLCKHQRQHCCRFFGSKSPYFVCSDYCFLLMQNDYLDDLSAVARICCRFMSFGESIHLAPSAAQTCNSLSMTVKYLLKDTFQMDKKAK